ncbi:YdhR family protein [Futiania mangrovi]|uniref:YdhR family protein n=1 Tax=Futiania mangrovi TaxID=2959716 RepID=A0A9J6PGF0_9PROT|nr:YdhR family protein [Futiania mangrovii]MCP1337817.1 YdhR family protein [Futiania mangrovii]
MITAVVQFKLGEAMSLDHAAAVFQTTAPRYRGMSGLVRKYYLFDPETGTGGGCYLFESRAAADAVFDDAWRALIREKYSAEPHIQYFETPVVVDNVSDEIVVGANAPG